MSRLPAEERLRRILAVVPWVAAADGPRLTEVCTRFGYESEEELQDDLNLLFLCGVPPYTPDALIEVDIADGRVWIRYADWFARPLRLSPAEALTLVAASSALVGPDTETPLARGLAKLARALGVDEDVVDVTLGPAPDALEELRRAAAEHHQVEIDYYAFGRDEMTTRVVDPHLVYTAGGQWYLAGFCHKAQADRLFRVDRVRRVTTLASTFEPKERPEEPPVFAPAPDDPVIVLDLAPAAAWVASQYPATTVSARPDGGVRVELPVSGEAWLARLLLRLGPDAAVVAGDPSPGPRAARRVLDRYRDR